MTPSHEWCGWRGSHEIETVKRWNREWAMRNHIVRSPPKANALLVRLLNDQCPFAGSKMALNLAPSDRATARCKATRQTPLSQCEPASRDSSVGNRNCRENHQQGNTDERTDLDRLFIHGRRQRLLPNVKDEPRRSMARLVRKHEA
jgi:hypothetical protein